MAADDGFAEVLRGYEGLDVRGHGRVVVCAVVRAVAVVAQVEREDAAGEVFGEDSVGEMSGKLYRRRMQRSGDVLTHCPVVALAAEQAVHHDDGRARLATVVFGIVMALECEG